MTTLLNVSGLTCRYGQRVVCSDLGFSVGKGSIVCLLGQSGCGKTTVLRAIAGFEPAYAGSITLAERVLSKAGATVPPEQRQIGMVFQDYALFPHLTVADNIAFGLHRLNATERQQITSNMLQLTRLQEYANVWPHQLSGGQQQRVALARALAPRPQLLLLDEPFSNLDTELRRALAHEIRALLKSQGTTAILVTHDQSEAFSMADEIGVMSAGKILQWGTPRELYFTPASPDVARFIAQGLMLPGTVMSPTQVETAFGPLALPQATDAKGKVDLLLRPWNVEFHAASPIKGRISAQSFQGSHTLTTLQLADGTQLLSQDEGFASQALDSEQGIALNSRHLRLFSKI